MEPVRAVVEGRTAGLTGEPALVEGNEDAGAGEGAVPDGDRPAGVLDDAVCRSTVRTDARRRWERDEELIAVSMRLDTVDPDLGRKVDKTDHVFGDVLCHCGFTSLCWLFGCKKNHNRDKPQW